MLPFWTVPVELELSEKRQVDIRTCFILHTLKSTILKICTVVFSIMISGPI